MRQDLTTGSVRNELIKLTLPMVWGVFAVIAFNLVDTYFVGQLGTDELAAISFTFPVVMVLGSVSMGLGIGASSVISRAIGEGDRHRVKLLTTNSLTLSLLIVGILIITGLVTIDPLFSLMGASGQILALIRQYMVVWYCGTIFLVVPMVGNSAIRASGDTLFPSIIMTVAAFVNIGLDWLLIFGWGIIPGLGLRGAALATVIARAITLAASLYVLHYQKQMLLWQFKLKQTWGCWKVILAVGFPAAATNMITPISIGIITAMIAYYGEAAVAGFGVASRIESFAVIGLLALSASIGPFVGQNWGAKQYRRVHASLRLSYLFCLIWGVGVAVILAIAAPQIAAVFDPNQEVVDAAASYLRIVPISYALYGFILVSSATFNALGKPIPAVIITFTRMLVVYVPLAYLSSQLFGFYGVFAAATIANFLVGLGAYWWTKNLCKSPAKSAEVEYTKSL